VCQSGPCVPPDRWAMSNVDTSVRGRVVTGGEVANPLHVGHYAPMAGGRLSGFLDDPITVRASWECGMYATAIQGAAQRPTYRRWALSRSITCESMPILVALRVGECAPVRLGYRHTASHSWDVPVGSIENRKWTPHPERTMPLSSSWQDARCGTEFR